MSTYPFPAFRRHWKSPSINHIRPIDYCPTKGDITIGHDVWIGRDVTILSG
jgi:acetyltransferase-like isoleucine patch superfamily enzyme